MRRSLLAVLVAAGCASAPGAGSRGPSPGGVYVDAVVSGDSADVYVADLESPLFRAERSAVRRLLSITGDGPICATAETSLSGLEREVTLSSRGDALLRARSRVDVREASVSVPRFFNDYHLDMGYEGSSRVFGGLLHASYQRQCSDL